MKAAFLPDRGVVKVSGEDARSFLNGLVTTDVTLVRPGLGRFGALLTPQGKITADFVITEAPAGHGGGFLLDTPRALAKGLADKLGFYKLRAKVAVENLSDSRSDGLGVIAVWDGEPTVKPDLSFADPRSDALGWRILAPQELAPKVAALIGADLVDSTAYDAHRIVAGVPRGGLDFTYGDAFPHETNMDRLHGVDFDKGCYVGQEVVSRMQHRGTARTRTDPGAARRPGSRSRHHGSGRRKIGRHHGLVGRWRRSCADPDRSRRGSARGRNGADLGWPQYSRRRSGRVAFGAEADRRMSQL